MNAVEIVNILNKKFESLNCKKEVHFVLHKVVNTNKTVKAHKEYDYTLWYLNDDKKYQTFRIVHSCRVTTEKEEENVIKYMESVLLTRIFSLFQDTDNLKSMLDGTFTGYGI